MTSMATDLPAPVLRTKDHVLASLPFLLGFQPQSSAVLMWLREGTLILTQRIDLPQIPIEGNDSSVLDEWSAGVVKTACHADSQEVFIAIFPSGQTKSSGLDLGPTQDCGRAEGASVVASLCRALVRANKYPCEVWLVIEDDFWDFDFTSSVFSSTRQTVDPQVISEVHDDFLSAGWRYLTNRQEVVDEFEADPQAQSKTSVLISKQETSVKNLEKEVRRDECISIIVAALNAGAIDEVAQAQIITGLTDIRVRDCVLWQLTHQDRLASCAQTLRIALRAAPTGLRAPLATVTALAFWLEGDGVRASAALKQATLDNADYGLAHLVDIALTNGVSPKMWNESLGKLPYEVCRAGVASHLQ
jgi:hypothetical protein